MRQILVTSALPYANGHIHIGHLVEYLQTDIWVRFQKLRGNRCIYICADDTHGTAIMIRARDEGIGEEELIAEMQQAHIRDFAGFDIEFDNYGSTHSQENRELCAEIWASKREAGLISVQEVTQLYDVEAGTFLADRFVRGTCPFCKLANQYGDSCDNGHHYGPVDLIDPVSTLSGTTPEIRTAKHLFVNIERLHGFLDEWTQSGNHLQPEIANYLKGHFLHEPLRDWDVSRPAPYFGFEIPDSPGNYWYVWFDAPIGYMASTKQWCDRHGEDFDQWWRSDKTEIHHFIGKDITYFHTLFWPAMLKTSGFSLPEKVHIHGFLTVNGEKMSKSKGTFVRASTYLEHLDPAYLRYYYAAKLTNRVDDIDLNLDEFVAKVNSDMVGNVVNLASRTAKFAARTGLSDVYPDDGGLFEQAAKGGDAIAEAYEACDYGRAIRQILVAGDRANQFVEHNAPWNLAKDPEQADRLRDVCTVGLNLFRQLAVYLAPVLPRLARQTGELLGRPIARWDESKTPVLGTSVGKFRHMMKRVDRQCVDATVAASTKAEPAGPQSAPGAPEDSDEPLKVEPLTETCTFDEFTKVDLRIARVVAAEDVPEASKLLKLTLSLGGEHRRTVLAGIKGVYQPADLIGRLVVCAANLAPRKMKFGTSEGMILASGPGGKEIFMLSVDKGARPGQRVH
ncbi:MAG: methionine--tRNA ligase [Pirellulales bacterium]|nr:methionine--tRNA ligase [Pirellulales bacterium]